MKLWEIANPWTPQNMDVDDIIQWCNEHAAKYVDSGSRIWRGVGNISRSGVVDTTKLNRQSAQTNGYYNMWIDNADTWREFPKRSKSLIASTNRHTAEGYGELTLLVPADNAQIGICPAGDMWISIMFPTLNLNLNDFMEYLPSVLVGEEPNNWEELELRTKRTTIEDVIDTERTTKNSEVQQFAEGLVQLMKKEQSANVFDCLEELLDPNINGFSFTTAAAFSPSIQDREVWVSGQVLQIDMADDDLIDVFEFLGILEQS